MRTSVVSFGLGSTTGSSLGPVEVDGQRLYQKLQDLHEFVEKSFRQQAKLLRELRRARRKGGSFGLEGLDSWGAPSIPDEEDKVDMDRSQDSQEGKELVEHAQDGTKAEENDGKGPSDQDTGENQGKTRPSIESILVRDDYESEGRISRAESQASAGKQADPLRASLGSEVSGLGPGRRFALRLTVDSAQTKNSARSHRSEYSASRSWTTDQSSPDSFVHESYQKHFTAARVQATWKRRRAASADTIEEHTPTLIRYAKAIVDSKSFYGFITLLIFLHVVLMGVEVDLAYNGEPLSDWFGSLNVVFVSCFVAELLLKFVAIGCSNFWRGTDWAWNFFDFFVITCSVLDVILQFTLRASVSAGQVRVFRILRIFRYLRSIRVVRLFRYISALQVLTLSILGTMSSLAWTLALLLLIIYSFAVVLTEIVMQHCAEAEAPCDDSLTRHWANVRESMLSLFMAISQGLNWEDLVRPLLSVSVVAGVLLVSYVIMTIFAILNVVTGVFCNTAIESAGADKDVRTLRQIQDKDQQVALLKNVFAEIDFEQVNEISFEDVKRCLANGDLASFVESMGISTDDVWTLFMLLDADQTGLLDIDEFVNGCMQLRGPAKSLQVAKMSYENKLTRIAIKNVFKELAEMKGRLDHMHPKLKRATSENGDNISVAL